MVRANSKTVPPNDNHLYLICETGAADLGEANGKDGVRAAAGGIHARAAGAAMGVAQRHQVLHVLVVGDQAFRQICTQGSARPVSLR